MDLSIVRKTMLRGVQTASRLCPPLTRQLSNDSRPFIEIIGVPLDLGAGRRGVDAGPSGIRYAGLHSRLTGLGHGVYDRGNLPVPNIEESKYTENVRAWREGEVKHGEVIGDVVRRLADTTHHIVSNGNIPLTLGGDHSVAAGSMAGYQKAREDMGKPKAGLLWFDAHTDFNTPDTSPSGNLHGMPCSALMGLPVSNLSHIYKTGGTFDKVAMLGIRDVDPREKVNLAKEGLIVGKNVFTMREIDELGMREVMTRILDFIAPDGGSFGLSLDIDGVDPSFAPGVGTPVPGGITYREAHLAMELVYEHGGLGAMDLVECNPILDQANITSQVGVDLVGSAFGRSIV